MDSEDSRKQTNELILVLNASSVVLLMGSLFMIQIFAVLYGVANGASGQSTYSGVQVATQIQYLVSQTAYLHEGILESYVLTVIAIILLETSFLLFLRRTDRTTSGARKYVAMHTAFTFVYALIFGIIYLNSSQYLGEPYVWSIYIGIPVSLIAGVYLNYVMRVPVEHAGTLKRSIKVDPTKPFSNIMELQDKVFNNLHGHLRVVDKHFNSAALSNFHRIIIDNIKQFNNIDVITSTEMSDSSFGRNLADFKRELELNGVKFELRFMDDEDKIDQHERIMLDDSIAYKIPPFNIINKRSEHIILINHAEAQKRFDQLYSRAINFENYSVKKARANPEQKPSQ